MEYEAGDELDGYCPNGHFQHESFEDDMAWLRELDIHRFEQQVMTVGLTVTVNALLATVDCVYRFPNGDTEIYTLERVTSPEGDYLQWWRNNNGWHHRVNPDCTPFSYSTLLAALETSRDAEPFLALLTAEPLAWLATIGCSLDRIIPLTWYMQYEYPKVYWLILASSRDSSNNTREINRALLARCLAVTALTSGQLTAIRKLYMEEWAGACHSLVRAVTVIARHWQRIRHFIVHEPGIAARELMFLDTLASHGETIRQCRWLTYAMAERWFSNPANMRCYTDDDKTLESLFLLQWFSLVNVGIKPQHLHSDVELEREFIVETDRLLQTLEGNPTAMNVFRYRLFAHIDPALHERCESLYDELRADILYNDDSSRFLASNTAFVAVRGRAGEGFTPITTAGELRAIAEELDNCAALRVKEGISGRSEFWRYQDPVTGELALLQIDTASFPTVESVVEFNGMANQGVSEQARAALRRWLAEQGTGDRVCLAPNR